MENKLLSISISTSNKRQVKVKIHLSLEVANIKIHIFILNFLFPLRNFYYFKNCFLGAMMSLSQKLRKLFNIR